MNQNKLSFESENLVVDYISFKFQKLDNFTLKEIASYLFEIGFNSYSISARLAKPIKESILVDPKNRYEVLFVINNSYWEGTKLDFSGLNGKFFYSLVQQKLLSWELFSSATLGRFDINFSRKNRGFDKTSVEDFFEDCHKKVRRTNKNVKFEKKSSGISLKIQNRKSDHFYRIYQSKGANSIKFEYEMRGKFIRNYQRLLVSNCLEEFESSLSYSFFFRFGKLLSLSHSQLDWLVLKLRPFRKQKFSSTALKSHYIRKMDSQTTLDRKKFFTLLRFLVYAQTLDYEIDSLKSTRYRLVRFRVQDFLRYTGETYNYYQLKKLIEFFDELQTLVEEGWIAIDRSKRGPASHKAFLTKEGKKLVKDRQKDFQFIFLMKEPDSYVFTDESNHSKILTRETITKAVNLVTRTVSSVI